MILGFETSRTHDILLFYNSGSGPVKSNKMLVTLASIVILIFVSSLGLWPNLCSFHGQSRVWERGVLFNERMQVPVLVSRYHRGVTARTLLNLPCLQVELVPHKKHTPSP
jgi:hypothetical protein